MQPRLFAVEFAAGISQTGCMTASGDIAILRIELEHIKPLIWRRVAVRSSVNLKTVHKVIQAAMGWLDYHLWEFNANERIYSMLIPNDPDWNSRITDAATTKLSALLTRGVRQIGYVYDMGDNWQHRIIVETLKQGEAGAQYPQFLGGERRCPPEDVGGIPGFEEFSEAMTSPRHPDRKRLLTWYGGVFNRDDIDLTTINARIDKLARRRTLGNARARSKGSAH